MKICRHGGVLRWCAIALLTCAVVLWARPSIPQVDPSTPSSPPASTLPSSQTDPLDRLKILPFPTQLIPGQSQCLVLDSFEDRPQAALTPQEEYARDQWDFPERWVWRQVCAGQEANFLRLFFKAWLVQHTAALGPALASGLKADLINRWALSPSLRDRPLVDVWQQAYAQLDDVNLWRQWLSGTTLQSRLADNSEESMAAFLSRVARQHLAEQTLADLVSWSTSTRKPTSFSRDLLAPMNLPPDSVLALLMAGEVVQRRELAYLLHMADVLQNTDYGREISQAIQACLQTRQACGKQPARFFQRQYREFLERAIAATATPPQGSEQGTAFPKITDILLDGSFLQAILLREPFRSALPGKVMIKGAYFHRALDLSSAEITHELRLEYAIFRENVQLFKTTFAKSLYFDQAYFSKALNMNDSAIQGTLFMRRITLADTEESTTQMQSIAINLSGLQGQDIVLGGRFQRSNLDLSSASINDFIFEVKSGDDSGRNLFFGGQGDRADRISFRGARVNIFSLDQTMIVALEKLLPQKANCTIDLARFQYQKANEAGFRVIEKCLEMRYQKLARPTLQTLFILNSQKLPGSATEYATLLQPVEQAAQVARDMGHYQMERELLYKRKRLEVFIERARSGRLTPTYITLTISDFLYGFGYHRYKAFKLFILVWFIGAALACLQLIQKQHRLIKTTVERLSKEAILQPVVAVDSELANRSRGQLQSHSDPEQVPARYVYRFLSKISKVVLSVNPTLTSMLVSPQSAAEAIALKTGLFVQFDAEFEFRELKTVCPSFAGVDSDGYIEVIFQNEAEIEQQKAAPVLDLRDTHQADQFKAFIHTLDARDPDHESLGFLQDIFPGTGQWAIGPLKLLEASSSRTCPGVIQLFHLHQQAGSLCRYPLGMLSRLPVLKGILALLLGLIIGFLYIFPAISVAFIALDTTFQIAAILLFILLLALVILQAHAPAYPWGARVARQSMLFSLDILFPIITLDDTLQRFIFEDAEGLPRLFFLFQKMMAAVLASILLPIFFVTGL